MKIKTTPVISEIKETERKDFSFYEGKVISSSGKWKSSTGMARIIKANSEKNKLENNDQGNPLQNKRNLHYDFSIKVQEVASPEKPKKIAAELDKQTLLSGDGTFDFEQKDNPIQKLLLEPSLKLIGVLEENRTKLRESQTAKLNDTSFKLIDSLVFQDDIQRDLHFKVLKETIRNVKNPKSLKLILDTMNSNSMNQRLSKSHRSALKKALRNRMAELYGPTMNALQNQKNKASSGSKERIKALGQSMMGMHDLIVAVKEVSPKLLDQKTGSNHTLNRQQMSDFMVDTAMKMLKEMNSPQSINIDKSQMFLKRFNAIKSSFLTPALNLTSKKRDTDNQKGFVKLDTELNKLEATALLAEFARLRPPQSNKEGIKVVTPTIQPQQPARIAPPPPVHVQQQRQPARIAPPPPDQSRQTARPEPLPPAPERSAFRSQRKQKQKHVTFNLEFPKPSETPVDDFFDWEGNKSSNSMDNKNGVPVPPPIPPELLKSTQINRDPLNSNQGTSVPTSQGTEEHPDRKSVNIKPSAISAEMLSGVKLRKPPK